MVNRQFCSAPDPDRSLIGSKNASGANHLKLNKAHGDGHSPKTLTCRPDIDTDTDTDKNGSENANNNRRMSLASRAGALVRQISSRANLTSETRPLNTIASPASPPSAKMALFHTRTASVHVENGEWSLALKSFNRALIHHRQLYGQDSSQCATTLNGIGVCLMNLATGTGPQSRGLDEESRLCRDYVRYAECALREALYIRERIFGSDSDEVEEVEINMELLLGSGWNDEDDASEVDRSRTAASQSRGSSNPPSRCSSTDSLSGNNFQKAACRLFGGNVTGNADNAKKRQLSQKQHQMSGNDTASSSSSSSSTLSSQEEQIDFQYPSSFDDIDLLAKDQCASSSLKSSSQPCSSSSNKSLNSSSSHSTASFGNVDDDDDDGIDCGIGNVIGGVAISEIDLWTLDDSSGDELKQHRSPPLEQHRSPPLHRPLNCRPSSSSSRSKGNGTGRPSPTRACNVLFPSINK